MLRSAAVAGAASQVEVAASQVAGGALEVASLGDAFGAAVAQFGSDTRGDTLERAAEKAAA